MFYSRKTKISNFKFCIHIIVNYLQVLQICLDKLFAQLCQHDTIDDVTFNSKDVHNGSIFIEFWAIF